MSLFRLNKKRVGGEEPVIPTESQKQFSSFQQELNKPNLQGGKIGKRKGGCGDANTKQNGGEKGGFNIAPFLSALAILGTRLVNDKNFMNAAKFKLIKSKNGEHIVLPKKTTKKSVGGDPELLNGGKTKKSTKSKNYKKKRGGAGEEVEEVDTEDLPKMTSTAPTAPTTPTTPTDPELNEMMEGGRKRKSSKPKPKPKPKSKAKPKAKKA